MSADGLRLDYFRVGLVYDVGPVVAALLLSEQWAVPEDEGGFTHAERQDSAGGAPEEDR